MRWQLFPIILALLLIMFLVVYLLATHVRMLT
jgi:hypothetical protein